MLKIKKYLGEMQSILQELKEAEENIKKVSAELEDLDYRYQSGQINYSEYTKHKNRILSNKSRNQVKESYELFVNSLNEKLLELNNKIFKIIYSDKSYEKLSVGKTKKKDHPISLPSLETLEIGEFEVPKVAKIKKPKVKVRKKDEIPKPRELEIFKPPKPVKLNFWKRLVYAFQAKEKPWLDARQQGNVAFGGIFSADFLRYLLSGKEKEDFIGKTQVLPSILSYEGEPITDKGFTVSKSDILDPYMLEKQIKELKSLISKKKPEVYQASTLGYVANISVRKLSIYFIEKYPGFFKRLYTAVRNSNIKILANTYINIMIFLTLVSGTLSVPIFTVLFALQNNPIGWVFLKTLLGTLIVSNIVFWISFYYPFMKAKSRRRSINTNLPFAIDHMASVIASGVSPSTMFKLISHSREYGEISVEIEKVTNYVEFFGYDILTALRAVALTTPSEDFKEFIDGFVSTIETGGDVKEYLSQKSQEALLNYRLERQKYVESLSTYSDIYTGVLIAAPLFFVTALSLVSVLGGTIGGISINVLITIGTYLVIPGLNLLFLIFLELNQPEI